MNHDVRAVLDRPAQERRGERVVDHERNAGTTRDLGQRREIDDIELGITDRLGVEDLGVRP